MPSLGKVPCEEFDVRSYISEAVNWIRGYHIPRNQTMIPRFSHQSASRPWYTNGEVEDRFTKHRCNRNITFCLFHNVSVKQW